MTIEEQKFIQKILAELAQKAAENSAKAAKDGDFERELKVATKAIKTTKEPDVEGFKKRLTELGAAGFLSQMNEQKIQEKLRAKKEELMEVTLSERCWTEVSIDGKNVFEGIIEKGKTENWQGKAISIV